jgi:hypothetical protein
MVVSVPADVSRVQTLLPRAFNPQETIALRLKRKLEYAGHYKKANIRPERVIRALEYLVTLDLWKQAGVTVNERWSVEYPLPSASDPEVLNDQHTHNSLIDSSCHDIIPASGSEAGQPGGTSDTEGSSTVTGPEESPVNASNDMEFSDSNEEDAKFLEKDPNEEEPLNAGNLGTLLENVTSAMDVRDQIFCAASGEGNRPLGLYQDEFGEELCFPNIYCGLRRPPLTVLYHSLVKWELRNADRRSASCIDNIFFKLRKCNTTKLSSICNVRLRKSKLSGKADLNVGKLLNASDREASLKANA